MTDAIMGFISDHILDSIWADIVEVQFIHAAAHVAFNLAFVTRLNPDDEATLASGKRKVRS